MSRKTTRHSILAAITLVTGLLWLGTALATPAWRQAVPFWHGKPDATGWSQLFHANANQALGQLPAGVQTMLKSDIVDNPWIKGHEEMKTKLANFRPEARQVFDLPYIPIPADKMKFSYMDSNMSQVMKKNVRYTENGREMIRFFFHPLYADKYKELITTYGAKYGEYWATPTSSPRSLVVWKRDKPNEPIWVKVSLHAHLDYYTKRDTNGQEKKVGISRVQTEKKAHRSALVNAAFASARGTLGNHLLDFMPEPASFVPGKVPSRAAAFDTATIFREIPTALTTGGNKWVPAFTFIKNLKTTAQQNNLDPVQLAKTGLIEPLVRSYLYLGVDHGLQGELHTQNFLLETNGRGLPTGRVMIKDLDGFRMDVDMRIRNGKDISFLDGYKHPFEWAKHSATQGSSSSPAVLHAWFNKLIRNVNGFTTTRNGETVYATPSGQLMDRMKRDMPEVFARLKQEAIRQDATLAHDSGKAERKAIETIFDGVAREQFKKITGIEIPANEWGYGQNKGLNWGLNRLREQLFAAQQHTTGSVNGSSLSSLWNAARTQQARKADDRTFVRGAARTHRLIGHNIIEGVSLRGKPVGYVLLKPNQAGRNMARQRVQHHLSRYASGRVSPNQYGRPARGRR